MTHRRFCSARRFTAGMRHRVRSVQLLVRWRALLARGHSAVLLAIHLWHDAFDLHHMGAAPQ